MQREAWVLSKDRQPEAQPPGDTLKIPSEGRKETRFKPLRFGVFISINQSKLDSYSV